jgi:hypothetical protein
MLLKVGSENQCSDDLLEVAFRRGSACGFAAGSERGAPRLLRAASKMRS